MDECRRQLSKIVVEVFNTMLDTQVSPSKVPWEPGLECVVGVVRLSGGWEGAVSFQCSLRQAARFSEQITRKPCPLKPNRIVRDVVGELANVITGNIKCFFPRGVNTSFPLVMYGTEHSIRIAGPVVRLPFLVEDGEVFWIGLRSLNAGEAQGVRSTSLAVVA